MNRATSIDEVIQNLDFIIAWSEQKQNRIGYFAVLYKQMTLAVKKGIINHSFMDGQRMELLDVIFANRYIDAWRAYTGKEKCTNAWCAAFNACENKKLIVLQHLILGINTHINLDLAIAAAEACPGETIHNLQQDFDKINDVIASLTNQIQERLSRVWFPLRFLEKIANNREDAVLNFSIGIARKASWNNAVALTLLSASAKDEYINNMDRTVVEIANRIITPGLFIHFILTPVLLMEDKNVSNIINLLNKD